MSLLKSLKKLTTTACPCKSRKRTHKHKRNNKNKRTHRGGHKYPKSKTSSSRRT